MPEVSRSLRLIPYSLFFLLSAAASLPAASVGGNAQKLLERHLRARGGHKTYQQIKTRRTVATVRVEDTEVKTVTLESLPEGRFYQVLEIPTGKTEVGFDGHRGWHRSVAAQGLMEPDDPRGRALVRANRATEFWDYKKDERRFEYGGKERFEGAEYEVLQSTLPTPDAKDLPAKYYFTAEGMLHLIIAGSDGGTRLEFSDFRQVDGITYPFHTKFTGPQTKVDTVVTEIKHNVPVDSAVFEYREQFDIKP